MPTAPDATTPPPRFSVVSAVYNVEAFLDDFIASIDKQDFPLDRVEVIMVDDGSTDSSSAILKAWQDRSPGLVTVLTKPNGGQGSARNLALEHARGEWVTMPDPDDILEPNYLSEVDAFLRANPRTAMIATNRIIWKEATGERVPHVLGYQFEPGNQLVDLDQHPTFFHGSAPASFFRLETLQREQLRFDERIRPNFEDGHFCSNYVLRAGAPLVGFVSTAEYIYRKRANESSTLNTSRADARRFTDVPKYGYLAILEFAAERYGAVPEWLQNFVLYELSWYLSDDEAPVRDRTAAVGEVADTFYRLLGEIMDHLDPDVVANFSVRRLKPHWRETLLHLNGPAWHTPYVVTDRVDTRQRATRIVYRFTGERPDEVILVDGVPFDPEHHKVRAQRLLDHVVVQERIVWVPSGTISVRLDGTVVPTLPAEPAQPTSAVSDRPARPVTRRRGAGLKTTQGRKKLRTRLRRRAFVRLARSAPVRRVFGTAWVLMDRITDADDNAEHLFRYLRAHEPSINAWFVIQKGAADHRRLCKDGYRRRVIAYGSLAWHVLMLNCDHLISSHADVPITHPPRIRRLIKPNWRFVFLQHGVTKDDISRWLNPKNIDVFVVSTPAEYAAVAGDGTSYRYTSREVALTGLPRFDLVREAGAAWPPDTRDLILIAPTWRNWLAKRINPDDKDNVEWGIDDAEFTASDYWQNWSAVLASPQVADLAKRNGLKIALLMHPNLQSSIGRLGLPPGIELLDFNGDTRGMFARTRVTVTDYSSMVFNSAYIDRPTVYFQFDLDRMDAGGHIGPKGYFEYERDGFGPVTYTVDDAVRAIDEVVDYGPDPQPEYQRRIQETFPQRDGRCRERTLQAILDSAHPVNRP